METNHCDQSLDISRLKQGPVVIVMVPFPEQGHLNQLLQLSCIISSYGLQVHCAGFSTHNRQAKLRANGLDPKVIAKICFHDFPTPPFLSPPPNPNSPSKFPAHQQPSWEASKLLRTPVAALLRSFSTTARRIIVIHDPLMASVVQDAAFIPNAELYAFNCTSAFTQFVAGWEASGKPFQVEAVPEELPSAEGCVPSDVLNDVAYEYGLLKFKAGDIYNTCRSIEGAYIDLLAKEQINGNKKLWAIGPIIPETRQLRNSINRHKCLEWLDNQSPKSVIYVSFGTTISLADEQIKELAFGLEQSGQKFIWVLRDADKGDIFAGEDRKVKLPEGFEERVEGVGMVVRDWAPQPQILSHPSTGGFMCHCGWNSCMESITVGVPIAAWPMHSDQPRNTALITQVLGVGIVVRSWEHREELVISSTIEKAVQRLMGSKEGDEIRKRAEELRSAVRQSTDIGGVSRRELDSFIAHIVR